MRGGFGSSPSPLSACYLNVARFPSRFFSPWSLFLCGLWIHNCGKERLLCDVSTFLWMFMCEFADTQVSFVARKVCVLCMYRGVFPWANTRNLSRSARFNWPLRTLASCFLPPSSRLCLCVTLCSLESFLFVLLHFLLIFPSLSSHSSSIYSLFSLLFFLYSSLISLLSLLSLSLLTVHQG